MKKDNEYIQLAIDLFVYADWTLSDLSFLKEKGFLNDDEWNFVKKYIEMFENAKLEKYETDDLKLLETTFPNLKNDPQFRESLIENYRFWQEEKNKLEKFINSKLPEIASSSLILKDFLIDEWKKKLAKCDYNIWRIRRILKELGEIQEETKITTRKLIEEILEIDITDVIEFYTNRNVPRGRIAQILCPLHNEKNPSFTIFRETNSFYCFGCNRGGSSIQFIQYLFNINFYEAVQKLKEDFNIK